MRSYRIAAIPGDGIGTEVIAAGVEALTACAKRDGGFAFVFEHFDWGSERYKKTGAFMPENGRDLIKNHDAILFGSAGAPDIPDHVTLWGLRLAICQPFDQYANVRPTRILPGIVSPLRNVSGPVTLRSGLVIPGRMRVGRTLAYWSKGWQMASLSPHSVMWSGTSGAPAEPNRMASWLLI